MPYVESGDTLIYFSHVPKAAGTTIEHYLTARFDRLFWREGTWAKSWHKTGTDRYSLTVSLQHLTAADAGRLLPRIPDHSFMIVRDPADRVVSEFGMQCRSNRRRRSLTRLGFSVWLGAVLAASRHDPNVFDNHFRQMCEFELPDCRVFRLEDGLRAVTDWIDALAPDGSGPIELGHAQKGSAMARPVLTRAQRHAIERHFRQDYERFYYPTVAKGGWAWSPLIALGGLLGGLVARAYQRGRI